MRRVLMIGAALLLAAAHANAAGITLAQLQQVDGSGRCLVRPTTAGAGIYAAIVAGGLSHAKVVHHAASRLGYGVSPRGPLTPVTANDCTTVFIADEIARQIASLGATPDTAQLTTVRAGVTPLTMFRRADLNLEVWAQQQDPQGVALNSFALLWYEARSQHATLKSLREAFGSQRLHGTDIADVQVNVDQLLVELWHNHFNVSAEKANQFYYGSNAYPEVVRAAQGGTFEQLLVAVMREPAMLYYLDNKDNRCDPVTFAASNQNLARELLELHTLGVPTTSGAYAERDVAAVAEVLCGWNVIPYSTPIASTASGFVFNASLASPRAVSVLGASYAANGALRVPAVLHALAVHAATRTNICTKLATRLYAPSLAGGATSACAASWGTSGNLKAMVTALVARTAFWQPANYRTLQRTPIELVIATLRHQGASILDFANAVTAAGMTHTPFAPATLTPQLTYDRVTALRLKRPFLLSNGIVQTIKVVSGMLRDSYAAPNGYSMDGATYLSSSYVDSVSRVGLLTLPLLTNLDAHRTDVSAAPTRAELATRLEASVPAATDWFIETKLGMGDVIGGGAAAPFAWPASHVAIAREVMAASPMWAYWETSPTVKQAAHTVVGLGLGNAQAIWR